MTPIAKAAPPTRSTGTITLSWGLITIPLSAYNGSEESSVARKEFIDGDPEHPSGRQTIDKKTNEAVDSSRIVKMAEATPGVFVTLDDDEIRSCTLDRGLAMIESFVPMESVSLYVHEDVIQVRPQSTKGKVNPAVKRAFSLLLSAMADRAVVALVKFSLRGPARYGLLYPTGDLFTIKTADQVRQPLPLDVEVINDAEMRLALDLIDAVGLDEPVLMDDTALKVRELILAKVAGKPTAAPSLEPPVIVDLMASLGASIAEAKAKRLAAPSGAPVAFPAPVTA